MEIWSGELLETEGSRRPRSRHGLGFFLTAVSRWRQNSARNRNWRKAIRALHLECDRLRRQIERGR